MCGIAGIFNFRSLAPIDRAALWRMGTRLAHRGPDASGYYVDEAIGLAHRRLSILDLSERGRQPMATADGRYVITFNGEIYNYIELRRDLVRAGVSFRSDTDTEVLLALYAREGSECVKKLNGMFAFAIWDAVARELFVARDRVGIKPLYFTETRDGVAFASEAKALFEHPGVTPSVDASAIDTYLTFGYTPGERTLFRGVRKLLPGHSLRVSASGMHDEEYWDVQYAPDTRRSERDTAEQLRALLLDSVRLQLRSDVPVGVFLSGGLDSSTVVALLSEAGVPNVKTFSVAYRERGEFDEGRYATLVSRQFRTEHHSLYVDPAQFVDFVPGYVHHMDEPVTEAAALSLYFVSKLLRQHVTVALSGEGADELFAGYDIYRYMRWIERYRSLPSGLRRAAQATFSRSTHPKLRKYAALAELPLDERYLGVSLRDPSTRRTLYTREFAAACDSHDATETVRACYRRTAGLDSVSRMLYADLKTWLVDDLLIKADKMTMATAVELRVPFLDHRVVEFAATVPTGMKLRGRSGKWILKRAMQGRLPEPILRRSKLGFPTPLTLMFRNNLGPYLRDLLLSRRCVERGYLTPSSIGKLLDEHASGAADHAATLWQLAVLEEWHRCFIDRPLQPSTVLRDDLAEVPA